MKWEAKIILYKGEKRIAVIFKKDTALIARKNNLKVCDGVNL